MFILLKDKILNREGEAVFTISKSSQMDRAGLVQSEYSVIARDRDRIACGDEDEARACLQALAEKLYAQRWDSQARCFADVRFDPGDVAAIIKYMTEDNFPASLVKDVAFLVSKLNWSEESLKDITDFILTLREKEY